MSHHNTQTGFTLIELLVVITIIGILVAAGFVFFAQAQVQARDARRDEDLRAIQQAFEQFNTTTGAYPDDPAKLDDPAYFPTGSRPNDPKNTGAFIYSYSTTPSGYCTCAALESPGKGNAIAPATAQTCSFGAPAAGAQGYFCEQGP